MYTVQCLNWIRHTNYREPFPVLMSVWNPLLQRARTPLCFRLGQERKSRDGTPTTRYKKTVQPLVLKALDKPRADSWGTESLKRDAPHITCVLSIIFSFSLQEEEYAGRFHLSKTYYNNMKHRKLPPFTYAESAVFTSLAGDLFIQGVLLSYTVL